MPMRSHTACAVSGTAGEARIATMRNASRASPMTASRSGPGSAFHGSLVSRWALVARMSCHVASSARLGCTSFQRAVVSVSASAAATARGLSGRGRGPTPSHFLPTTVATRLSRLPRLLARSLL
ncbi:unannotated protein [freshwater metagenome]|uniref:Unannotated protein n=1 Tax=freshwater metagenome TaxID=449393 RepID=A0A6J6G0Q5_9ZZZZ